VASLSQGRTAAAQCGLFTHKSVPVIFEPPCIYQPTYRSIPKDLNLQQHRRQNLKNRHVTCRHATAHPTCQFGTLLSGSSLKFYLVHRMQLLLSCDSELTFKVQRTLKTGHDSSIHKAPHDHLSAAIKRDVTVITVSSCSV